MKKEEKDSGTYSINITGLKFIPIMILIGIVPLIVRLVSVELIDPEAIAIWNTTRTTDLFSQFKASFIVLLTGVILICTFLIYSKKDVKQDHYLKIVYIGLGAYSLFTILSTLVSKYEHSAVWGVIDRAEGGIVLIAYVIIMLYALYIVKDIKDYRYIVYPLLIMTCIMTVLGFYQYIGEDLFLQTEWGQKLIIPDQYKELRGSIEADYESKRAYGTVFHYNYVGSLTAMMIPMFAALMLMLKGWKTQILCGIGLVSNVLLLFFSSSRGGIVGVGASILVLIILNFRYLAKKWKIVLPIIILAIGGILGLNSITKGEMFERIPSLVQDAFGLFLPATNKIDYKQSLPLQDITHEGEKMILWVKDHQLHIEAVEDGLSFKDEDFKPVEYILESGVYTTTDERFKGLKFSENTQTNDFGVFWKIHTDMATFNFVGSVFSGVHLVDNITLKPIELQSPEYIGFEGKERIGSARGYIWSRTLPLLKERLVIGEGPDCFIFAFPQYDYLGKLYAYGTSNMIVDKPHNLYLQIGINQGGIALVGFLTVIITYFVQSLKLYAFKKFYQERQVVGIAFMVAIVGYLVAGVFNDSIVSVAPIFWVLLGVGMAINYINMKQDKQELKDLPHATIDMKKRKHIVQE